jgi:hypothetical protein
VGERLGDDGASRTALEGVVTDGVRRPEPFLEVARLEQVALPLVAVGPDPRVAVGLELMTPVSVWTWWPTSWPTT